MLGWPSRGVGTARITRPKALALTTLYISAYFTCLLIPFARSWMRRNSHVQFYNRDGTKR